MKPFTPANGSLSEAFYAYQWNFLRLPMKSFRAVNEVLNGVLYDWDEAL